jgi:hypothetical protein
MSIIELSGSLVSSKTAVRLQQVFSRDEHLCYKPVLDFIISRPI